MTEVALFISNNAPDPATFRGQLLKTPCSSPKLNPAKVRGERYPPDNDFSTVAAMTSSIMKLQEIKSGFNSKMLKFNMSFAN